jgi:hypothetical protein
MAIILMIPILILHIRKVMFMIFHFHMNIPITE